MHFGIDWIALFPVAAAIAVWMLADLFRRKKTHPRLPVSSLAIFQGAQPSLRQILAPWPRRLLLLCLALFLCAALNPRLYVNKDAEDMPPANRIPPAIAGAAIYFVLDQSGSMEQKAQISSYEGRVTTTKLNLLKQVTKAFIAGDSKAGLPGRPNDMIGLVSFARTAQVLSPLTLDHQVLIDQLNKLEIMRIQDQDGTGIGYAIYKTAHLIAATRHFAENLRGKSKPAYEIKDAVMILVTDGMQDPNPLDQQNRFRWMDPEQAAAFAKAQKIRLYVVNIDPEFTKPEWEANRKQMQRMAEMTGGRFYALNSSSNIASIYKEIDSLEKSVIPLPLAARTSANEDAAHYTTVWLYPYLIGIGMCVLALSLFLQTTWLRVVP